MKLNYPYKLKKNFKYTIDTNYFEDQFIPWFNNRVISNCNKSTLEKYQLHHYPWRDIRKHFQSDIDFHKKLRRLIDNVYMNLCSRVLTEIEEKDVSAFVILGASKNATAFGWHKDDYDIVAVNIIGQTTWEFENGVSVKMDNGDVLYCPRNMEHKVTNHSGYRCTMSLIY